MTMFHLLVLLSISSIDVSLGNDFVLHFTAGEDIPYVPVDFYNISDDIRVLDSGIAVETFDEALAEEMLNSSKMCEVSYGWDSDHAPLLTPALCTNSCSVNTMSRGNSACQQHDGENAVCCPVNAIPFFFSNFPPPSLNQHESPHKFKGPLYEVDWNQVRVEAGSKPINTDDPIDEKEFIKEINNQTVCGVKTTSTNDYEVFFCVESSRCSAPHTYGPYLAKPAWNDFCQRILQLGYPLWLDLEGPIKTTDKYHFTIHDDLTGDKTFRCCHPNYIDETHFSRKYTNLKFKRLPNFLTYAKGVRSSLMCEAYSRFVCGNSHRSECPPEESQIPRPPDMHDALRLGDAPYLARLGVVAPNVLIFHCLGAIVSYRYILSVWECRQKHGIDTNIVVLGEEDTDDITQENVQYEQVYTIYKIIHIEIKNDEPTLYRTTKDIKFSPRIRPVCLYYGRINRPKVADLPYFGKLQKDFWQGRYLRRQKVNLHPQESYYGFVAYCRETGYYRLDNLNLRLKTWGPEHNSEFCGGYAIGSHVKNGPCKYDRGSPLVVKMDKPYCSWLLIGSLTSEKWDCELDTPLVFTNITKYLTILEDIIWPQPFLEVEFPPKKCNFPIDTPYWSDLWDAK